MSLDKLVTQGKAIRERLIELGADVPPMPESAASTMAECKVCEGKGGRTVEGTFHHCHECGGSGQIVHNEMMNWAKVAITKLKELTHGDS